MRCPSGRGRMYGATVLAVRDADGLGVSPGWDRQLPQGTTQYYVAAERIDAKQLAAGR